MPVKERIFGYDILKALAAFLVVLYHVGMVDLGYRDGQYYYPTLVQVIWLFTACGVPLFFMVNGALTVHRDYDLRKTAVKIGRLLFAGVFWGVVAIGMYMALKHDKSYVSIGMVGYY
ncbi:MAG: acyltransferase family protein, partial [Muribaculaceae bacterium]|nr:acyltransferase family protein [Muribaculaceae bacterium]